MNLIKRLVFFLLLSIVFSSCDDNDITIPQGSFDEHLVDLQGTWKINQAFRNNINITDLFQFEDLSLTLEMDSGGPTTFDINPGKVPFVQVSGGSWSFNDNIYPTSMQFSSSDGQGVVEFTTAPFSGDRSFSVSFSLGCGDNTYIYKFIKQ